MNLNNLSSQNFEEIFNQIIDAQISENQTKDFLLALNNANLPTNAFIGAVIALKKRMKKINAPKNAIDVCGTGGDKLNTLNISTAVCFVLAAAGVVVAKHGNKAISSKSGSADIFVELGIKISAEISEIEKNLNEKNLCFLFAPFFHEALKNVAEIRQNLGVPTIFNFLGPLLNPANTSLQLIGTSKKDVMSKMLAAILKPVENGEFLEKPKKIYIVHGFDGMDEISLCANSYLLKYENGKIFNEEIINPQKFGFKKVALKELLGGSPKENAQKLLALLAGEKSAYRDIVVLNAAFALKLASKVEKIEEGVELAKSILDKRMATKILKDLQT
jgi:anthranilate phosphoribosyltransferase